MFSFAKIAMQYDFCFVFFLSSHQQSRLSDNYKNLLCKKSSGIFSQIFLVVFSNLFSFRFSTCFRVWFTMLRVQFSVWPLKTVYKNFSVVADFEVCCPIPAAHSYRIEKGNSNSSSQQRQWQQRQQQKAAVVTAQNKNVYPKFEKAKYRMKMLSKFSFLVFVCLENSEENVWNFFTMKHTHTVLPFLC